MAHISPFNGIRFSPQVVPDLSFVVAPPYDVLSGEDISSLHARSRYNITQLTRPSSYESAAQLWRSWRESGVLATDSTAMYLCRQTFSDPETGSALPARTGLICALDLEGYETGGVLPHENTIAAHRADRLELMRATHANFESIYGLYPDSSGDVRSILTRVESESPVLCGVRGVLACDHTLQRIDDRAVVSALQAALGDKAILIADGHHRYETALAYRREHPDEPGAGAILVTLTAFEDDGLLVLPTHRLVRGVAPSAIAGLPERLPASGFTVTSLAPGNAPLPAGAQGFDMLLAGGEWRVMLDAADSAAKKISGEQSHAWKTLDVTILHKLVLEDLLSIPMATLSETDQVRYTRDASEARSRVESGEFQAAFMLSRPVIETIRAVSAAGERMPQKSTFFYPKLLSGLVMRSLE